MRILYAFDNRVPSPQADTEQLVSTLAALSRRGVDATLLLPRVGRERDAEAIRAYYRVEGSFDVAHFRCPRRPRVAQKLGSAARAALAREARTRDLVYTRNLPVAVAAAAAGHRVALDTYRPWPAQIPPLRPLLRRLMGSRRFVGAVLHSRLARRSYLRLGVPEERLLVAHNGYEPAHLEPTLGPEEARGRVGLPRDRPTVVYTGRVDRDKGLDAVLETARRLPGAAFVLVGASGQGAFEREAAAVDNVELVPWQPVEELAPWLYAADVLLLPPSRAPVEEHGNTVLPMKLFKYLAAGRAVLGPRRADLREILTDGENARLVAPGDPEAAASALAGLLEDEGLRRRLAEGASRTARDLTWDARARRIHRFLERRLTEG